MGGHRELSSVACVGVAVLAGAVALALVPFSVAQEEAPPRKPLTRLRPGLHLQENVTYHFEYTESVTVNSVTTARDVTKAKQVSTATWNVSLSLVSANEDGSAVVRVVLDRLRGEYDKGDFSREYDSDEDTGNLAYRKMVGKDSTLEIAPTGLVLTATGAIAEAFADERKEADRTRRPRELFQWLFGPFPERPAGRGKKMVTETAFTPNLVVTGKHECGTITETTTLKSVHGGIATTSISAKGSNNVEKKQKKAEMVDKTPTKWKLTGGERIDLETGVRLDRNVKGTLSTFMRVTLRSERIDIQSTYEVDRTLRLVPDGEDD